MDKPNLHKSINYFKVMGINNVKIIFFIPFVFLLSACDKGMGIYFKVQARNDLNENVTLTYGQNLYGHEMSRTILQTGETKELKVSTGHNFNGWGHDKALHLIIRYMLDTIAVNSSLGVTENVIRKADEQYPNDTLFEFIPIPENALKGTVVYTLVIDSALYK